MQVLHGDCLEVMASMPECSIDAIVTDPPYGLSFMGREWDHGIPGEAFWREALRVAKPGAHLVAFGGTRTHHRLMCGIEDAGWEIRDCLGWLYGSGFPKSLDVSKAIDKAAGAARERIAGGVGTCNTQSLGRFTPGQAISNEAVTTAAAAWVGYGTALKPAWEPIVLARKPLAGTVAANVQKWGTGALNIDASRIPTDDAHGGGAKATSGFVNGYEHDGYVAGSPLGRWPANIVHDGSDEVLAVFPQTARSSPYVGFGASRKVYGGGSGCEYRGRGFSDSGSAARFFYCAKASRSERGSGNSHPTVKPLALMRWLVRMVTPPDGVVLDPFAGSGTTLVAAKAEGFDAIGIELEAGHVAIIEARVAVTPEPELTLAV